MDYQLGGFPDRVRAAVNRQRSESQGSDLATDDGGSPREADEEEEGQQGPEDMDDRSQEQVDERARADSSSSDGSDHLSSAISQRSTATPITSPARSPDRVRIVTGGSFEDAYTRISHHGCHSNSLIRYPCPYLWMGRFVWCFCSTAGPSSPPAVPFKLCVECEDQSAEVTCLDCEEDFCKPCFSSQHRRGKRHQHRVQVCITSLDPSLIHLVVT